MRIGVFSQAASVPSATLDDVVAEAQGLEAAGFAFISYPHVFNFDAMTLAAIVGRETDRIELATGVVPSPPRHPVVMAQQALTVQAACDGRFTLGIGLSHQVVIEGLLGLSYARPAAQMREYLRVLAPLLRAEPADCDGEIYRVHARLDVAGVKRVPLLVAALGPRMLELTGALADGTSTWMSGLKTLSEHIVPSLCEAARNAGRSAPRIVAALPTALVSDVEAARAKANRNFAMYNTLPSYRAMLDREGDDCQPGDVALLGDEAHLRERLERLREAGVTDFCAVLFRADADSRERTREFLASEL